MALFNDGKDADALRTIGEVGSALGIKAHILRYWEEQFPQLKPLKRAGGRRLYRPADVALIQTIDRLVNQDGYTLKGARAALKAGTASGVEAEPTPQASAASAPAEHPNRTDILPRLKAIRAELAAAIAG